MLDMHHGTAWQEKSEGARKPSLDWFGKTGKRVFDVIFSAIALVLLSPLFLVLSILVKRDGGPAFFGHERVGMDGQPFKCWKIRTMVPDAEQKLAQYLASNSEARAIWERDFKFEFDPRITALGGFLRRTSLDELPQFWNVLIGEMSVVGPRPVTRMEVIRFYDDQARFVQSIRPGVTGLWQVSGRNGLGYATRVALDVHYVANPGFAVDLAIIARTVVSMLRRTGV